MKFFHSFVQFLKGLCSGRSPDRVHTSLTGRVREDHKLWLNWQKDLEASRQALKDKLEMVIMTARQIGLSNPEEMGVCKKVAQEIKTTYTQQLIQKHEAIKIAFRMLGPTRKVRTPKALSKLLKEYGNLIIERRQQYQQREHQLSLAKSLLQHVINNEPWTATLPFEDILENPEISEARLALQRLRWENQQIYLIRLQNSLQNRLIIGERWLLLIKPNITTYAFRLGKKILNELREQLSNVNNRQINSLMRLHKRLDTPLLKWNKEALNNIVSHDI